MVNVSQELEQDTKDKVEAQFIAFIGTLSDDQAQDFFRSFFTESEQMKLIKRLAIIMMLEKSVPHRHIAAVLDVSPMTVSRINKRKEDGEYDNFTRLFANEKRTSRFWKALQVAIEEGVHRYSGSSWGWLDRIDEIKKES